MKKSHVVTILNQKLTLRADEDEEYVKKIAEFVEGRVQEVIEKSKNASSLMAALLVCLNITDELFRVRKGEEKKVEQAARVVRELIEKIDTHLEGEEPSAVAG